MSFSAINEIRPYLYLCSYMAITEEKLKRLGITHIVDATNRTMKRITDIEYFLVELEDSEKSKINKYFDKTIKFINDARDKDGKILVYCAAGISRSASLVLTYLMIGENMPLRDAYYDVSSKRPIIAPNEGFWRQMIEYEKEKRGETTVEMMEGKYGMPDVYLNKHKMIEEKKLYDVENHESSLLRNA